MSERTHTDFDIVLSTIIGGPLASTVVSVPEGGDGDELILDHVLSWLRDDIGVLNDGDTITIRSRY